MDPSSLLVNAVPNGVLGGSRKKAHRARRFANTILRADESVRPTERASWRS